MKKQRKPIGTKQVKTCETCQSSYSPYPYKNETSKYCSRKCYLDSHKKKEKSCIGCGKSFTNTWGVDSQKYCTKKCYLLSQRTEGFIPNYNKSSIRIIDEYAKLHGLNFQHAENGGEVYLKELGYWLDAYDRDKNVVLEYMEKFHNRKVEYDERRKKEIVNLLGCIYIEIWE